jgi:hypothetical protein
VGHLGRPANVLARVNRGLLIANSCHAVSFNADHVYFHIGGVFVYSAVPGKTQQSQTKMVEAEKYLSIYSITPNVRERCPVRKRNRINR